ncbi:heavy-metal-associated domain-containing protein [Rhizobium sp. IMFF44]|uniref:heavy-metal-associated domain-containing protein n=1 Tax=unclassified Rhizobium TaxID=2613769 RepID=UPI0035B6ED73
MRVLLELRLENMTCGCCLRSVTEAIQSVDPDAGIETSLDARTVVSGLNEDIAQQEEAIDVQT